MFSRKLSIGDLHNLSLGKGIARIALIDPENRYS